MDDRFRPRWAYLLVLAPMATEWLEAGRLPASPRDWITEVVVGMVIAAIVWSLYRAQDRYREQSEHDDLTGCFNRRRFDRDLEHEYTRARRQRGTFTLAYVDIDRFKAINDTRGHAEGDAVLRETGALLRGSSRRQVDRCYRIGGDEFAVLLLDITPEAVKEIFTRLRERAAPGSAVARNKVTYSFGAAGLTEADSLEDLLHRADALMYERKRQEAARNPA